MNSVPLWEKPLLTLQEASEYFNIGITKIREITNEEDCDFVFFNGNKRLIKRENFNEYIKKEYSI